MIITNKINVYVHQNGEYRLDAVQGDTGRVVQLSLYTGDGSWPLPEGAAVQIRYRKPDGTGGFYDTLPDGSCAYRVEENRVVFALAPQMLTVPGEVEAQVLLLWKKQELATFTIRLQIQEDPSVGVLESEDFVNLSTWIGEQVEGYLNANQEELRELYAVPGAYFVTVALQGGGWVADRTFADLQSVAGSFYIPGKARPIYCLLCGNSTSREYMLLPLTSYYPGSQTYRFFRVEGNCEVCVTFGADGIAVSKVYLALQDQLQESFVVHVRMSEETEEYEADQTYKQLFDAADELFAGGNARPVYCAFWTDSVKEYILLPLTSYDSRAKQFTFTRIDVDYGLYVTITEQGVNVVKTDLGLTDQMPTKLPNPNALTINGKSYDGSQPVEVVAEPLVVIVDDTNNSYTTQNSLEEVAAALEAGRDVWCECAGGRFPFVDRWGSTAASHGYHFCGIKNGIIHKVSFGTDGVSVSIEAPQIMQTYHLIQKIELAEESNSILFSNLGLRALRAFFVVPQAAATTSVGAELYMGSTLAGTAWLPNLISDASERVSMVEGWQDGGLVGFAGVAPANTTQQAQTYSRNPRYTAASGNFTKLRMYGSSGKLFPAGTVVELWGY